MADKLIGPNSHISYRALLEVFSGYYISDANDLPQLTSVECIKTSPFMHSVGISPRVPMLYVSTGTRNFFYACSGQRQFSTVSFSGFRLWDCIYTNKKLHAHTSREFILVLIRHGCIARVTTISDLCYGIVFTQIRSRLGFWVVFTIIVSLTLTLTLITTLTVILP